MECNREEALRAREIAAEKLKHKDFLGARRIAFKAQRLSPELENIHGLLTVCEVHCAAAEKINEDLDWYSILQVEATADDTVIRKQYDKLAFWLQPDKNTLSGAEVALKYVSEAREILCDRTKRALYDIKRQDASKHVVNKATQLSNKAGANSSHADGCKQSPPCVLVFWTICPHCRRRFVYYRRNFLVLCDDCGKLFFAFKLHEQAVPLSFLSDSALNAVESPSLWRSARRRQDVDGSSSLNFNTSKNKQKKNDFPSNADLNLKQIIVENVSVRPYLGSTRIIDRNLGRKKEGRHGREPKLYCIIYMVCI
jgi:curved DNA-binding protein CbpA